MLNNWCGAGRLTKNPELRQTQNGKDVVNFTIAVDRDFKNQDGDREVDFFDITAWEGVGRFVNQYFEKGSMIIVNGRLQTRDWQDDEGNKRRVYEIIANGVYFGGSKSSNDIQSETASKPQTTKKSTVKKAEASAVVEDTNDTDDNLPF